MYRCDSCSWKEASRKSGSNLNPAMSKESFEIRHAYYFDADKFERSLVLTDDEIGHGPFSRPGEKVKTTCLSKFASFINDYFLPIGLLTFVVFGALVPQPGVAIAHRATSYVCVTGILFYIGLFLKTNEMKAAIKGYRAVIWGLVSILFCTSFIGSQLTNLLKFDEPSIFHNATREGSTNKALFGSSDFKIGFQLFFIIPCTISSGVLMVNQLGGNYALAVLLTVVCNGVGMFTVPPLLNWLLASKTEVKLDIVSLLDQMLLTLLLPVLVGKGLQYIKPFFEFCKKIKPVLRIISISFLICLVFTKISQASAAGSLEKVSALNIVLFICWSWTVHSVYLILNGLASFILRLSVVETKCIVILASQKSVTIALSIVNYLPHQFGDQGLMAIPLVISHLSVVLFDACFITIWLKFSPIEEDEQEKPLLKNATISGYTEPNGSISSAYEEDQDPVLKT